MRPKSLWIVLVLALIVALTVGVIQRARRVHATTDVAKLEADVREHLPAGSSRHPRIMAVNDVPHALYLMHENVAATAAQSAAEVVHV